MKVSFDDISKVINIYIVYENSLVVASNTAIFICAFHLVLVKHNCYFHCMFTTCVLVSSLYLSFLIIVYFTIHFLRKKIGQFYQCLSSDFDGFGTKVELLLGNEVLQKWS